MDPTRDAKTSMAFAGAVLIGGANFVAVSFSNMEMPPLFGAAFRFGVAALLFFALALATGVPIARGRAAVGAVLYGLLGFGAAYAFLYYALVGLSAGTTAVFMAAVPLITMIMATIIGQERITTRGIMASLLVVAGIAVLSQDALGEVRGLRYIGAALGGTIAAAASSVVAKRYAEVHPISMNAIGMAVGTLTLAVGSIMFGESWGAPQEASTWIALAWLITIGSVALFQLFLYVIRRWTASATVYAVTGMPVVAAALGALMLGQPITARLLIGGAIVIGAVKVGTGKAARTS